MRFWLSNCRPRPRARAHKALEGPVVERSAEVLLREREIRDRLANTDAIAIAPQYLSAIERGDWEFVSAVERAPQSFPLVNRDILEMGAHAKLARSPLATTVIEQEALAYVYPIDGGLQCERSRSGWQMRTWCPAARLGSYRSSKDSTTSQEKEQSCRRIGLSSCSYSSSWCSGVEPPGRSSVAGCGHGRQDCRPTPSQRRKLPGRALLPRPNWLQTSVTAVKIASDSITTEQD